MRDLLWAAIAIPAIASAIILATARLGPWPARILGVLSLLVSLGAMLGATTLGASTDLLTVISPLDIGIQVPLGLMASGSALTIGSTVALVATLIQLYATGYLAEDDRYPAFAATVSLFTAAMLLVVTSADLVLTVIGWEIMGWCSYLLIGHWSRRELSRAASQKAYLVTRVADIGFVLGAVTLIAATSTSAYPEVIGRALGSSVCADGLECQPVNPATVTIAMVLLVIGVLGKSAQLPFQDWLPDAMEGPTPASALIHAATMVAAGTFVLARLGSLLDVAGWARVILGLSVAVTMVLAGLLAFGQADLKRLLAWSTVSQVAIMLTPLAISPAAGGSGAGLFHLFGHAFFKALLFLGVGWLAWISGSTLSRNIRGLARSNTLVRASMGFGLISLAGIPIGVGGISKEHVLSVAYEAANRGDALAEILLATLSVSGLLTAAYAMRAWVIVTAPTQAEIDLAERWDQEFAALEAERAEYAGVRQPPPQGDVNDLMSASADDAAVGARAYLDDQRLIDQGYEVQRYEDPQFEGQGESEELIAVPAESEFERSLREREVLLEAQARDEFALAAPTPLRVPWEMAIPLILLLAGTLLGGLILLVRLLPIETTTDVFLTGVSLAFIALGAVAVWSMSDRGTIDPITKVPALARRAATAGLGWDRLYVALAVAPTVGLARLVARFDNTVIDATGGGIGRAARIGGAWLTRVQRHERPGTALLWIVAATIAVAAVGVIAWR